MAPLTWCSLSSLSLLPQCAQPALGFFSGAPSPGSGPEPLPSSEFLFSACWLPASSPSSWGSPDWQERPSSLFIFSLSIPGCSVPLPSPLFLPWSPLGRGEPRPTVERLKEAWGREDSLEGTTGGACNPQSPAGPHDCPGHLRNTLSLGRWDSLSLGGPAAAAAGSPHLFGQVPGPPPLACIGSRELWGQAGYV